MGNWSSIAAYIITTWGDRRTTLHFIVVLAAMPQVRDLITTDGRQPFLTKKKFSLLNIDPKANVWAVSLHATAHPQIAIYYVFSGNLEARSKKNY